MQLESTSKACPLCRREQPGGQPEQPRFTRLCLDCQSLVAAAFPVRGVRNVGGQAVQVSDSFRPISSFDGAEPEDFSTLTGPGGQVAPDPFETIEIPEYEYDLETRHSFEDLASSDDHVSTPDDSPARTFDEQVSDLSVQEPAGIQESSGIGQSYEAAEAHSAQDTLPIRTLVSASGPEYDREATDPWNDPLPAWDRSLNEYPVLLSPDQPRRGGQIWVLAAVLLLVALAAAAYLLIYEPWTNPDSPPESAAALAESQSPPAPAAASTPQTPASGSSQQSAAPAPEAGDAVTQADPNAAGNPAATPPALSTGEQGNHTLQAAAFPTEAEADIFAAKLTGAGIPARVVPADVPGRGRWFRVRIGRFMSPGEAERYGVQARQQAQAAGVNLRLMVIDYEKP